jgi:hypothetical protein
MIKARVFAPLSSTYSERYAGVFKLELPRSMPWG